MLPPRFVRTYFKGISMLTDAQRRVRLILQGRMNNTEIANQTNCSRNTVSSWRKTIIALEMDPDAFDAMDDLEIRQLITPGTFKRGKSFTQPDWHKISTENSGRGVQVKTLFEEYLDEIPENGFAMSRGTFYRQFQEFRSSTDTYLSFEYEPGEMVQADFIGRKRKKQPLLIDDGGHIKDYELFCAVSVKSRKTFVIAIESQAKLPALLAFVAMLRFFGGVPVIVTIDNFAAAVATPKRGQKDAVITPEFQELADHFGFGLVAARVRKPRDKGLVENAVGICQNDVLAPLRNRRFFSLSELNEAIRERLDMLNTRPMKGHGSKSRDDLFDEVDASGYRPLPSQPFEPGQWLLKLRAGRDYHVHVLGNRYSVPARFANQLFNAKVTAVSVHLLHGGRLIATHVRSEGSGRLVTDPAHMPPAHLSARSTRLSGIKAQVQDIGPEAIRFIEEHFRSSRNPSETATAAAKIRTLTEQHTVTRVEIACGRALFIGKRSVQTIENILNAGLDALSPDSVEEPVAPSAKANIRGPSYYSNAIQGQQGGAKDV